MNLISNFLKNSGIWILISMIISKVFLLLMSLFLVRFLPKDDFGTLTIALNFAGFFLPALGFGSNHGLLRFGSGKKGNEKNELDAYSLKQGFVNQIYLSIIFVISTIILHLDSQIIIQLTLLMLIRLFGLFFLEQAKAELRASFDNKKYAQIDIFTNLLALILGVLLTFWFGIFGYIVSLCVFPFSIFLFHHFSFNKTSFPKVFKKEFWDFSIKSGLTIIVFMWLFLLDIFFVGRFFSAEEVSFYKVSTLIPMSLFFISQVYTQTLYPEMCKNHHNKTYLVKFVKNYYRIFLPITAVFLILGFFFDQQILHIFGASYNDSSIQGIMFLQMASIMLLRIPFGSLMGAMGNMGVSLAIGIFMLVSISTACLILLPTGKPIMAAYISLFFITLGGLVAGIYFFRRLMNLKDENP